MNNQREKNYDANNYFCFINFTCEYIDLKIVPSPSIYMTYCSIVYSVHTFVSVKYFNIVRRLAYGFCLMYHTEY